MLRVEGLRYTYPNGTRVLRGVNLEMPGSSFTWMCGASGGGKSTLLRALTGLIPHMSDGVMKGNVSLDGDDTRGLTVAGISRHVGLVLQDPSTQLFGLDARECVSFALQNAGMDGETVKMHVSDAMGALGINHLVDKPILELSGGEQQLVALASALALKPRYLVLDEPFSELDTLSASRLHDALRDLHDNGHAVVVAEHRLEMLRAFDALAVLGGGRISAVGDAGRVIGSNLDKMRKVGLRLPQTAEVAARLREPLSLSAGDFLASWSGEIGVRARPRKSGGKTVLRFDDVHHSYGKNDVLRGIDLDMRGGELLFLVGPNGSGKTTLARLAAGLIHPASGKVDITGDVRKRRRGPRPGVGLVFQHPERQLIAATVGEEAPVDILAGMGLSRLSGRSPHLLSRGQKMRLALAGVLAQKPRVLIVDEPTLGQDGRGISAVFSRLVGLKNRGTAVVVITHDMRLVATHAQRVAHLENGVVEFDGAPREYFQDRQGPPVVEITRRAGTEIALTADELVVPIN